MIKRLAVVLPLHLARSSSSCGLEMDSCSETNAIKTYQNGEIERLTQDNGRSLIEAFIHFPVYFGEDGEDEEDYAITAALRPENERKNRYVDILPYDRTRVHLDDDGAYINANYVTMKKGRKWIASQGPLESTSDDFWRMGWYI